MTEENAARKLMESNMASLRFLRIYIRSYACGIFRIVGNMRVCDFLQLHQHENLFLDSVGYPVTVVISEALCRLFLLHIGILLSDAEDGERTDIFFAFVVKPEAHADILLKHRAVLTLALRKVAKQRFQSFCTSFHMHTPANYSFMLI